MSDIILLIVLDKCTNYTYCSISKDFKNIKNLIMLNNIVFKYINNIIKFINICSSHIFNKFIISFVSKLKTIIKFINISHEINIKLIGVYYIGKLIKNKLIIRLNVLKYIIVYIPDIKNVNIKIKQNGYLINFSSFDSYFLKNIVSIIKNIQKFNVYTNTGIKYLNETIKLKKKSLKNV